jgi:hypothetical protein
MSFCSSPLSIRLGRKITWPINSVKNHFALYKRFDFIEMYVLDYFISVVRSASFLSESLLNGNNGKDTKGIGSFFVPGKSRITHKANSMLLHLNYYLDIDDVGKNVSKKVIVNLNRAVNRLSTILGIQIVVINVNYYYLYINGIYKLHNYFKGKKQKNLNIFFKKTSGYIFSCYKYYTKLGYKLKKYKNNRYFNRVFNVLFTGFNLRKLDFSLIIQSIAIELKNLRKLHKRFILFVCDALKEFYLLYKYLHTLSGMTFVIQGRLILNNRETRRSIKKVFRLGKLQKGNANANSFSISQIISNRYGAINVELFYSYKDKQLSLNHNNSNKNQYSIYKNKYLLVKNYFVSSFMWKTFNIRRYKYRIIVKKGKRYRQYGLRKQNNIQQFFDNKSSIMGLLFCVEKLHAWSSSISIINKNVLVYLENLAQKKKELFRFIMFKQVSKKNFNGSTYNKNFLFYHKLFKAKIVVFILKTLKNIDFFFNYKYFSGRKLKQGIILSFLSLYSGFLFFNLCFLNLKHKNVTIVQRVIKRILNGKKKVWDVTSLVLCIINKLLFLSRKAKFIKMLVYSKSNKNIFPYNNPIYNDLINLEKFNFLYQNKLIKKKNNFFLYKIFKYNRLNSKYKGNSFYKSKRILRFNQHKKIINNFNLIWKNFIGFIYQSAYVYKNFSFNNKIIIMRYIYMFILYIKQICFFRKTKPKVSILRVNNFSLFLFGIHKVFRYLFPINITVFIALRVIHSTLIRKWYTMGFLSNCYFNLFFKNYKATTIKGYIPNSAEKHKSSRLYVAHEKKKNKYTS